MIEESRGLPWRRVPLPLFNGLALQAIRGKRGGMGRGGGADKMVVRELGLVLDSSTLSPMGSRLKVTKPLNALLISKIKAGGFLQGWIWPNDQFTA